MKKLLIAIAAAATAIGTYATTAIGGAGFDTADTADKYSWTQDGDFSSLTWVGADADGVMTRQTTGLSGFDADSRPAGYNSKNDDGFMALKTTFGNPVTQYANEGSIQRIGDGFYYDGLVKFTACDETPDLTAEAYKDAKIGFFPLLESDEDNAKAYLCIWAAGNATNLWKTTTEIDDAWHRVTIKMIANANRTGDPQAAFVVFIDGNAVNCVEAKGAFTEANLTPAAKKFWMNGELFASLVATGTEVTGVLYDGQGSIDEVGFANVAPFDAAADAQFFSVTWDNTIDQLYLIGPDGKITPASGEDIELKAGSWSYYYDAAEGYISVPESAPIAFTPAKDTPFEPESATEANVYVNGAPFAKLSEAVAALDGDAIITFKGDYKTAAFEEESITIANANGVTTIDLGGNQIKADLTVNSDLVFTNSVDTKTGDLYNGQLIGDVSIADEVAVEIYGGYFSGEWASDGDNAVAYGGLFSFEVDGFRTGAVESAEGFETKVVIEDELWEVVPEVAVMVPVTLKKTHAEASMKDGEENPVVEGNVAVGTTIFVEATADENYDTPVITVNGGEYNAETGYTIAETDEAVAFVVTASATAWTITYVDNGKTVDTDTYTVENRGTKTLLVPDPQTGFTFDGWYDAQGAKVESLADKTGVLTLTANWIEDNFVAKIGNTKYDTFAAALAAAKSGDTITLGQDINEPGIALAVSKFPGDGLTIDLNNHTYTFTEDATSKTDKKSYVKDCFTIQTNDVVTIKNGTIAVAAKQADGETDTNFRDVIRLYGNADSRLNLVNVKFDGTNLKALDPETKPVCVFSIEGGWFNIDANSEIDAGSATYAIKLGNHANATQYEVMTLTNAGTVKGDILITGGTYVENNASVDGTYWYGKNAFSTWADGVTSTLFAARIGGEPAEGKEDCACGKLYKTLAAAAAAAQAGDIVTIAKAGEFEESEVTFAAAGTFVVGSLADVTVGTLTLNGTKISIAEGGKLTNAGDIAGSIITSYTMVENTYTGSAVSPVVPGDPITTGDPATLANLINTDASVKAQYFKAPEGANVGASYAAMFVAAPDGDSAVKFVLTPAAEAQLQENANGEIIKIKPSEIAALTTESGEFKVETTIPGFYYAVKQGNGIGTMKVVEAGKLATDDKGIDLVFKKYDGAGFYQIIVSEKAILAE